MAAINPDPHDPEPQFLPEKCVTAIFEQQAAAATAIARLRDSGVADRSIALFAGEGGVRQLDVDGKKLSGMEKFWQALTKATADDSGYLDRANATLKQGGALVSVDTGDEESDVRRAASALKAAGGSNVQHWGQWHTEQF